MAVSFAQHPGMIRLLPTCFLVSSLLLVATGCNQVASTPSPSPTPIAGSPTPATPSPTPTATPTATPITQPPVPQRPLISAQGIGNAQLGMTLGELKQKVEAGTEFTVKSPFIVDFDAIAVSRAGKVDYYILYLAGTTFNDTDVIQGLYTENPDFQTAEGVGPGTLIREAVSVYGKATLSYNLQNEGREYVRFQRQPEPNISFATGNGNSNPAGIYASPTQEFNETQQFREDAKIQSVLVVCLSENCAR